MRNNNPIYLDNAATTRLNDEVAALFIETNNNHFANPNSIHELGIKAAKALQISREDILSSLKLKRHKVMFTSSSTEANNIAIKGYCLNYQNRGKHIITTNIEHPSVLECFYQLRDKFGFEITILEVNESGVVSASQVEKAMRNDTILVSIMAINNEIGSINLVEEIADVVHKFPKCNFHVDTTQAIGKLNLNYDKFDMFVVSAHKIHGLKGSGALIYKNSLSFLPLTSGGGQEDGFRSGTSSVSNAVCLAKAIIIALNEDKAHVNELYEHLINGLKTIDGVELNSPLVGSKYIVNFSLSKKKASVVVEALSLNKIYVSSVSACNSKKEAMSYVVKAIGKSDLLAHNTIRLSLDNENNLEQIDVFLATLKEILESIR